MISDPRLSQPLTIAEALQLSKDLLVMVADREKIATVPAIKVIASNSFPLNTGKLVAGDGSYCKGWSSDEKTLSI